MRCMRCSSQASTYVQALIGGGSVRAHYGRIKGAYLRLAAMEHSTLEAFTLDGGVYHVAALACIHEHHDRRYLYTSEYVRIRQHTSAYFSIRQHTSTYVSSCVHSRTPLSAVYTVPACVCAFNLLAYAALSYSCVRPSATLARALTKTFIGGLESSSHSHGTSMC